MVVALAAATLPFLPASVAHAKPKPLTAADLPRLTQELAQVTAHAQQLSAALDQAAARDGGLRVAYGRLEQARTEAQEALDRRARQVYIANAPSPVGDWMTSVANPDLRELSRRAGRAGLTVDRGLIDAVTAQAQQLHVLQKQADMFRKGLLHQAQAVLGDQDRARDLLAQAQSVADAEHAAALEAQRLALDAVSTTVTLALTPAQTARSRQALTNQAPVIALLERTGAGIPVGYARSGQTVSGQASWYGPGFVGRPTASGAPYDPERLTCANKELPLGTVIHVSANGLEINCLVNDRGPYVGSRILDMSRAGSRALGYDGLAQVTIEVLVPV
jgi:rare lipoprotein A